MANVLLVEDSAAMRSLVRSMIAALDGCAVREAKSGSEALSILSKERFDLIVTDIRMPDLSGLELIRYRRGHRSRRPAAHLPRRPQPEGARRDVWRDRGVDARARARGPPRRPPARPRARHPRGPRPPLRGPGRARVLARWPARRRGSRG